MKYYKIYTDDNFIGVVTLNNFFYENAISKRLLTASEVSGQYIEYNGKLYRDYWMSPITSSRAFTNAKVIEIDKEQYDIFNQAIQNNITINNFIDEEPELEEAQPIEELDLDNQISVDFIRSSKLKELSHACNQAIEAGFDYDGSHYSMSQYDQINLLNARLAISLGAETVSYHADNEIYRDYTDSEMTQVIEAAEEHKNKHLHYFNELKEHVNSLDSIEEISSITYNMR